MSSSSTTEQSQTPSVEDYLHPAWCDTGLCEPSPNCGGGMHFSTGTTWPLDGDAEVTVRIVRADDIHPVNGQNVGRSCLHMQLTDLAGVDDHGDCLTVSTWLSPQEARALALILQRYAELGESAMGRDRGLEHRAQDIAVSRRPR